MASVERRPPARVIFHSQGCQYTSGDYAALAAELGITSSVGPKAKCWDSAVSESWFATFKNELHPHPAVAEHRRPHRQPSSSRGRVQHSPAHSSLAYRSPAEYEATIHEET